VATETSSRSRVSKGYLSRRNDHSVPVLARFLQHLLPPSFMKIRHYGLMAPTDATTKLVVARTLLNSSRNHPPRPRIVGRRRPPPGSAASARPGGARCALKMLNCDGTLQQTGAFVTAKLLASPLNARIALALATHMLSGRLINFGKVSSRPSLPSSKPSLLAK
jgi:hypothetical protein